MRDLLLIDRHPAPPAPTCPESARVQRWQRAAPSRLAFVSLACAALSSVPLRVCAQADVPLDLAWSAPTECPDRAAVRRAVAERLGWSALPSTAVVRAAGRIERSGTEYVLELKTESGERRLQAPSCDELARSAALILALLIDPQAQPPESPITPPESTAPPATTAAAPERAEEPAADSGETATPEADREPATPIPVGGYLRAELVADLGMLPSLGAGPGIAGGLSLWSASLEVSAGFLLDNSVAYPDSLEGEPPTGALAQLSAFAVRFGLCDRLAAGPELGACLLAEYMRLTADPDDTLADSAKQSAPVWTLLAAVRLGVPIGTRFAWLLELSAGLPVHGARFRVAPFGVIHETGTVIGRLRTGLELRF